LAAAVISVLLAGAALKFEARYQERAAAASLL
jgi:hypothetical protein